MNALDMDWQMQGYPELIDISWDDLRFKPANPEEPQEGEGEGPVDMTSQEIMMSNEVEEHSDELRREQDDELRGSMGKTSIFFFDIENMGVMAKFVIVVVVAALFGAVGKFFYSELVE
mmetsp:Transcript_17481/g.23598  ORF Transcript_17481/g.23598 Transcript_17481/m.23598 type:complete len:118 (+) Transcript_17481:505-858(+)